MSCGYEVSLSHPTGNANVRQALLALYEREMLAGFYTTVAWHGESAWNRLLPASVSRELMRRAYPGIPAHLIHAAPLRELCRVVLENILPNNTGMRALVDASRSPVSAPGVYRHTDRWVANNVASAVSSLPLMAVYAYDGGALETFRAARRHGVQAIYELPTAHTGFKARFFREEAELQPAFAQTFQKALVDSEWLRRKDEELELADLVIVPSSYVKSTLPAHVSPAKVRVIPYGAPTVLDGDGSRQCSDRRSGGKLRVLYVGTLSQGKGLSYLLEAIRKVERAVEFTIIGTRVGTCRPLDAALGRYRWIASVPHSAVLEEMARHDVLAFPTLSEGLALVVLEAMSRGMAVVTTPNSGATGILRDRVEGFLVPIRSSEAIAEKLECLAADRGLLAAMQQAARKRAREYTWERYRERLSWTVQEAFRAVA